MAVPNTMKYSEVEITGATMLCIIVRQARAISNWYMARMAYQFMIVP
jgi:hypothetical protein